MKNALKSLFGVSFVVALIGCATTANYENVLNTWLGVHVDRLISSWGPPQASAVLDNGGRVLQYSSSSTYTTTNIVYGTLYSQPRTAWCKTLLTTDEFGIIRDWRFEGNACKQ